MTAPATASHEAPRRLVLGADAWQLLVEALGGLSLPAPLGADDGPDLDDGQQAVARAALSAAGVLTGSPAAGADLLAALHPSVRASLTVHLAPQLVIDTTVQRGAERRTARHAAAGVLAAGLVRTTVEVQGGRDTGPVELSTLLLDDLAAEVARAFGELPPIGDRRPARLDAAASLAVVRALREQRPEAAASVAAAGTPAGDSAAAGTEAGEVPGALTAVAGGMRAVARVDLAGAGRHLALVAVDTDQGWWQVHAAGEDVVLRPLDADTLVTRLAAALTAVLAGGAA